MVQYNRQAAVDYAHKWAFSRNPAFYNFDNVGGNCTNFVSQCIYAGCGVMNFTRDIGWYYRSQKDRAAAWTGVEYLYRFLIRNTGRGPYALELPLERVLPGDIIQLSFNPERFSHSLIVVSISEGILVAANTDDSDNRPLDTYIYSRARLLHIEGARS